jgi:prepilin-type N-terminal cleavage/methylation domain-containing protein
MQKLIKQAFTLIELLVVIAIIGILSGLIVVTMNGVTAKANIAKLKIFSNSLKNSLMLNLVSQYLFNDINSANYDPDTRVLNSVAGNVPDSWLDNEGTAYNGPLVKDGSDCVTDKCLSFDGSNDYVNTGSGSNLQNQNLTIEFWANASSIESSTSGIIGTSGYTSNLGFGLYSNSNNLYNVWACNGTDRQIVSSVFTITIGWNHYVITKSGSTLNAYKNGIVVKTSSVLTNSIDYTGISWYIGQSINSSYNFYGLIDDVRIYNEAISASLIKEQHYAGLNSLLINKNISVEEYILAINNK